MRLSQQVRTLVSVLLASAALTWPRADLFAKPSTDAAIIVNQFYPKALIDAAAVDNEPVDRRSCFAVYEVLSSGSPKTIMAGYSNGVRGAIRVIQAQPDGTYRVVFEPTRLAVAGIDCAVQLIDVDRDGINEIKFSFPSVRGNPMDWIFRWDGQRLLNIGPVTTDEDGTFSTDLMNVSFVDVRHDGTLQVFSIGEYPPPIDGSLPTEPNTLFKLVNGVYVPDKPLLLLAPFERQKGAPRPQSISFLLLQDSKGPYVVKVANGESGGLNRVSSAHVVLNGIEVLGPNRFNQQVEFISVPVSLKPNNTLQVTLEGKPGSKILVTVEDTAAVQAAQQQR